MTTAGQQAPTLGRYILVREIARSNDIVWEGRDPQMNRRVAVKELQLAANVTGQARRERIERFYREARAAGAMSHPNIVTIHEVGEDRGRFFIAMEFLEGQTLRERITVGGALALSEAIAITVALCDALEYAHLRGVIHRDIKPDNTHLLPGGRVKLTDFGIARITTEDQLTVAGQVFGTPSYMSPEQIEGRPIDVRSDLFSLGILLYEMISGQKPFKGDSVPTIINRIITMPTPHAPGASTAVDAVIQRATAKDPALRFANAADFRASLLAAAAARTGSQAALPQATPQQGSYAPAPQTAQQTAMYGAQTQQGVAPGLAPQAHGSPPPLMQATEPPPPPRDTARIISAVAAGVLLLSVVAFGGAWAVSRALKQSGPSNMAPPSTTFPTTQQPMTTLPGFGGTGGTTTSTGNGTSIPTLGTRPPLNDLLKGTPAEGLAPPPTPGNTASATSTSGNTVAQATTPVDNSSAGAQEGLRLFQQSLELEQQNRPREAWAIWQQILQTSPPGSKAFEEAGKKIRFYEMTNGQGNAMPPGSR